jgi:hypothetical protein
VDLVAYGRFQALGDARGGSRVYLGFDLAFHIPISSFTTQRRFSLDAEIPFRVSLIKHWLSLEVRPRFQFYFPSSGEYGVFTGQVGFSLTPLKQIFIRSFLSFQYPIYGDILPKELLLPFEIIAGYTIDVLNGVDLGISVWFPDLKEAKDDLYMIGFIGNVRF